MRTLPDTLYPFEVSFKFIFILSNLFQVIHVIDFVLLVLMLQCRQAKISYTGKFLVNICFQYGDEKVKVREKTNFGQFPIMLKVDSILYYFRFSYILFYLLLLFSFTEDC